MLSQYWVSIVVLTLVAFAVSLARGTRLLMPPVHRFGDLTCYRERMLHYGTASFYDLMPGKAPWTYPAPMALIYRLLYLFPKPTIAFLGCAIAVLALAAWVFARELQKRRVPPAQAFVLTGIALLTSYPAWWIVESGNMELFLVVIIGLGLISYMRGKLLWAAGLFGVATSLKLYPVIFLALFLSKKEFRKLLFGVIVAIGGFVLGSWLTGPNLWVALQGTKQGLQQYSAYYVFGTRPYELGFDHSLFTLLKHVSLIQHMAAGRPLDILHASYGYYVALCALLGVICIVLVRKTPKLNQILVITTLSLLLPPVSWDFRLAHLYVPWAFVVLYQLDYAKVYRSEKATGHFVLLMFLFAVLFTPESYLSYWLGKDGVSFAVGYGAQVKTLALIGMSVVSMIHPMVGDERECEAGATSATDSPRLASE